jgi:pimeloyl-ACP methyl ester carboxylesterase
VSPASKPLGERLKQVHHDGIYSAFSVSGEGPPLLLIHGADADHRMFDPLVERLANQFTCVAYDQRDSGHTWQESSSNYTTDDLSDDAAAVIRGAGFASAHVFGTSFGGQIAQNLAARHPDLVNKLVLGNTWRSGLRLVDINPQVAQTLDLLRVDRSANAAALAAFFHPAEYLVANQAVVEDFARPKRDAKQQARRQVLMSHVVGVDLAHIVAPTLAIASEFDRLVPASVTLELVQSIRDCKGAVLRGAGHVPCVHQPDALANLIRAFLDPPTH